VKKRSSLKSQTQKQRQALLAAAIDGEANAQVQMGALYRTGDSLTKQDSTEALRWYRAAAKQGHPKALNNVGAMYQHGMGAAKDMAEAAKWYRRPAEQGLATAQFNLALCLLQGSGVSKDHSEAAGWLHKAAAQGHIDAIAQLGTLYQHGLGVERRISNAAEFHVIAALAGEVESAVRLGDYRDELEQLALNGRALAAFCLAKMYDRGLGVEKNKARMYAWLRWGEQYGDTDEDPDVWEELLDMRGFYGMTLPDADKDDAVDLLTEWAAMKRNADAAQRHSGGPLRHHEEGH